MKMTNKYNHFQLIINFFINMIYFIVKNTPKSIVSYSPYYKYGYTKK